jgi:hypothetical protein
MMVLRAMPILHHIGVVSTDRLSAAVRRALENTPYSLRALAREAAVPHSTLVRIGSGSLRASPDVANRVAKALRAWGSQCAKFAQDVEQAIGMPGAGEV